MHLDSSKHMLSDARAAAQPPIPCNDHRRRLPLSLCFTQVATESPLVFFSFGRVEHSSVETPEESHDKKQKWWYVSDFLLVSHGLTVSNTGGPSHPYRWPIGKGCSRLGFWASTKVIRCAKFSTAQSYAVRKFQHFSISYSAIFQRCPMQAIHQTIPRNMRCHGHPAKAQGFSFSHLFFFFLTFPVYKLLYPLVPLPQKLLQV